MSVVGENIKQAREKMGLSQNQLAKKAGIAQPTLSAIEKQTKNPSIDTVLLLASALNRTVGQLVGEESNQIEEPFLTDEIQMLDLFRQLNETGKSRALDQLRILLSYPDMRKDVSISAMG